MAYGDNLHDDSDEHTGEPASDPQAGAPCTTTVMGGTGEPGTAHAQPDCRDSGAQLVGHLDLVTQPASPAPGADIEPSTALRIVDTVRLFNGTQLGRVLNDRQLHRHRVRSGRAFMHAPRSKLPRVRVLRYIAWLAEYRHLARQAGPLNGSITTEGIARLLDVQGYRCALTGRALQPEDASLDHIVPVSRGGPHLLENVQVLHTTVNRAKDALTATEFISLCREVAAWADRTRNQEPPHV